MKQFTLSVGLFACFATTLFGQALDLGCDGVRYKQDVFAATTKTTVDYAPTLNYFGNPITLQMDVYEPTGDAVQARPAIVLAHGGSFIFGDKSNMQQWCEVLARKGYVTVSIQYRLYPFLVLGFPDSVDIFDAAVKAVGDMKAAVRFLREDAAAANQFRIDPANIFIGGYSAGAVTALHAAYLDENDAIPAFMQTILDANGGFEGLSGTASNQTYSSEAKAVANMSGGIYRRVWIDGGGVPLVSIHGTADATVPYLSGIAAGIAYLEGSGLLHPQAVSAEVWSYLETVPGGGHSDIYDAPQFAASLNSFITQATSLLESLACASVSTEDIAAGSDAWAVGPNPVGDGRTIQLFLPDHLPNADLRIFDHAGKLIAQRIHASAASPISLGKLPAGAYTIQIVDPANPAKRYPARQLLVR